MLAEVLQVISPRPGGLYVDATVGAGGHAAAILEASAPDGLLLGLDLDPEALELAAQRLKPFGSRVRLRLASSHALGDELLSFYDRAADGVLLDLGVSSMQLDRGGRGFSFRQDAPLDMRMGAQVGESAAELLARLSESEMAALFRRLGEEPLAGRIARHLARAREALPLTTTGRLAALVEEAMPRAVRQKQKLHPATRVFLALRLAVNNELGRLESFLAGAPAWLAPGGVLAIISYHSLEDRLVKRALRDAANPCTCPPELPYCVCGKKPLYRLPFRKPRLPGEEEVAANPRARSAKLRAAVRTENPA
ncbi:MAG: 16S rRNA (cytosine(1402)-N(4))-methyltransferase RsmH [Deltaproteobacteria bacterium]|nr:16S rRNA (cytosine(1402)-N(4))-methyltransferase RsmH [Deltaproteobacteria bacterium]